jgi:transcriptional regulator with XRE-family HTH domain
MDTEMDLAAFLQLDVDKSSVRDVAKKIHISKTTLQKILRRELKTMPQVPTLEKIADYTGLGLSVIVAMTGATMNDREKYDQLARELEAHPWIVERFDELVTMSKEEFQETMDYFAYRREKRKNQTPPPQDDDQSTP